MSTVYIEHILPCILMIQVGVFAFFHITFTINGICRFFCCPEKNSLYEGVQQLCHTLSLNIPAEYRCISDGASN